MKYDVNKVVLTVDGVPMTDYSVDAEVLRENGLIITLEQPVHSVEINGEVWVKVQEAT